MCEKKVQTGGVVLEEGVQILSKLGLGWVLFLTAEFLKPEGLPSPQGMAFYHPLGPPTRLDLEWKPPPPVSTGLHRRGLVQRPQSRRVLRLIDALVPGRRLFNNPGGSWVPRAMGCWPRAVTPLVRGGTGWTNITVDKILAKHPNVNIIVLP